MRQAFLAFKLNTGKPSNQLESVTDTNGQSVLVLAASWGSGISAGVADAARSTGSSMQALGNMGSHGMFGGNAFRGGNSGGGQQSAGGGSGSNSGGSSGSNLSGKARGSRGKKAA